MAKITDPSDVEYLVFQGGGGKGVAYAGALRALEEYGVLPVLPGGNSQIKGIAGTSAGAITALFTAMGVTADRIDSEYLSKPELFTAFFDGPETGSYRTVSTFNTPGISDRSVNIDVNETLEAFLKKSRDVNLQNPVIRMLGVVLLSFLHNNSQLKSLLKEPAPEALLLLLKGLDKNELSSLKGKVTGASIKKLGGEFFLLQLIESFMSWFVTFITPEELIAAREKLSSNLYDYLYNVCFDRGFFPGFATRSFFQENIEKHFKELYPNNRINGATVNFAEFYELTGCNLIFTGVNVTKNKFQFFSKDHTPDFPVAEAAAISMNIPVVFKPVYIQQRDLEGFWVDGGTVNNLPLHAFDYLEKPELLERYDEELYAFLHPNVLALSLIKHLPGEEPDEKSSWTDELPILEHLGGIINTMWDPNESQIKREIEREQIIQFPFDQLSTLNFAPSDELKEEPIERAYQLVREYFE